MKDKKIFKVLLILVDIIAILALCMVTYKWIKTHSNQATEGPREQEFKKFTFTIPTGVQYNVLDEYGFELRTDNYIATTEPILNSNNFIFGDNEGLRALLEKTGYTFDSYSVETISDKEVLIFSNVDGNENMYLCYFNSVDDFVIQVFLETLTENQSYVDNLTEIIKIMDTATFDYESSVKYYYNLYEPITDTEEDVSE